MSSNKILNFQEYTTILNACSKKSGNLLNAPRMYGKIIRKEREIREKLHKVYISETDI